VSERARERLCLLIQSEAKWGIGCASAAEIDRFGIVEACSMAAGRAYRRLGTQADIGLFDRGLSLGDRERASQIPLFNQFTRGDANSFHIAAASILAKVHRDAIMRTLGGRCGIYGFSQHKGYGTASHFEAIQKHGPSRFHRRTFLH
jgi:ribonuclease HII